MKRTNVFTNERAEIRKRLADVGEALQRAYEKTKKFLEALATLFPSERTQTVIPPRLLHLATKHKKARVRKKNQKRICKMMYGNKEINK